MADEVGERYAKLNYFGLYPISNNKYTGMFKHEVEDTHLKQQNQRVECKINRRRTASKEIVGLQNNDPGEV